MNPRNMRRAAPADISRSGCAWKPDLEQARFALSALELERSLRVAHCLLEVRDARAHAEFGGSARRRFGFAPSLPAAPRLEQRLYTLFAD